MDILVGIFYGFLNGLNSSNSIFFLLKYGVLFFISFISILYIIKKESINPEKKDKKIFLYLFIFALVLLSPIIYLNLNGEEHIYKIESYVRIFAYFPLMFYVLTRKKTDFREYFINFSYIFNAVALIQILGGDLNRASSLMTHANFYAVFCVITIIFLFEKILLNKNIIVIKKQKWNIFYLSINLIMIFAAAGSRTSFFTIIIVLIATYLLYQKKPIKKVLFIVTCIFILSFVFMLFSEEILNSRIFNPNYGISNGNLNSFEWRLERWESILTTWDKREIGMKFFGSGWESSSQIDLFSAKNYLRGFELHNEYLRILVEFGFLGIILFISSLVYGLRVSAKNIDKTGNLSLFALLLFISIASVTENLFIASETFSVILISICVLVSITSRRSKGGKLL